MFFDNFRLLNHYLKRQIQIMKVSVTNLVVFKYRFDSPQVKLASLAKWSSPRLQTKRLWVGIPLLSNIVISVM